MTVPIYIPNKGWFLEELDDCGNLLSTRAPNEVEATWLRNHPVEGLNLRAEHELIERRRLLSDPVVLEALRNLRTARL